MIVKIFPRCLFLIPIRDPLQHSYSLLKQNQHFSSLQREDDFIRRYMNYLGHNEFGLDHKPWNNSINFTDNENINYWLEQWILFYTNILEKYKSHKNCYFLVYENLNDPLYIKKLLEKIGFTKAENLNLNFFKNSNKKFLDLNFDDKIYNKAKALYKKYLNASY